MKKRAFIFRRKSLILEIAAETKLVFGGLCICYKSYPIAMSLRQTVWKIQDVFYCMTLVEQQFGFIDLCEAGFYRRPPYWSSSGSLTLVSNGFKKSQLA
ncbi:hypothetical protein TNIN_309601 [Trichonephila inaurata madagascariensis]|uniref:Uncharacterized protein n=1 Tax=Trichonephila inaurata madagascariensis TaxID=2747483 RepID=A0A8X7C2U8_9ARAC|nr:hypothetical protein TNIN_309601 [Trichonephila inaurata madagascariensis]